jgi:hypothetical protein
LALAVPFMLWLLPFLAVAFSGRECDPGPPQPTWQCRLFDFSTSLFSIPFGWILGFLVDHNFDTKNITVAMAGVIAILVFIYLLWALVAYCVLRRFASIRPRISN